VEVIMTERVVMEEHVVRGWGGGVVEQGSNRISECVRQALREYFRNLAGGEPAELHGLVMQAVEYPLLVEVMALCEGNQSRAAAILGLNRATLRKKLRAHGLLAAS